MNQRHNIPCSRGEINGSCAIRDCSSSNVSQPLSDPYGSLQLHHMPVNKDKLDIGTSSAKSWWNRSRRHIPEDDQSSNSVKCRFSLFGALKKKPGTVKLNQGHVISEFFDMKSVVSNTKIRQGDRKERLVENFFDIQSVQTEVTTKRKGRFFSMLRRGRKAAEPEEETETEAETEAETEVEVDTDPSDLGVIYYQNAAASGDVPDDETITVASGLSSAVSGTTDESEVCSSDDQPDSGDRTGEDASKKDRTATDSTLQQMNTSPLSFPSPDAGDPWSSHSSTSFESSGSFFPLSRQLWDGCTLEDFKPAADMAPCVAAKQPMPCEPSYGSPPEDSKQEGKEETMITFLLRRKMADYGSFTNSAECSFGPISRDSNHGLKHGLKKDKPTYGVAFDCITIREYKCTVGDHPCCTIGPPISLDWDFVSIYVHTIDAYESLIKPIKRTKRKLYLSSRRRVQMLTNEWQVSEDDLSRARRDVTYVQSCRALTLKKLKRKRPEKLKLMRTDSALFNRLGLPAL